MSSNPSDTMGNLKQPIWPFSDLLAVIGEQQDNYRQKPDFTSELIPIQQIDYYPSDAAVSIYSIELLKFIFLPNYRGWLEDN